VIEPDNETFSASTHQHLQCDRKAAGETASRKIVDRLSETTLRRCFAEGEKDFGASRFEEDYYTDPMDSYGPPSSQ